MALITDAAFAWSSPVTLSSDEIWQARSDGVFVTTTATPDADDGLLLLEDSAVQILAGQTVRYRRAGSGAVVIVRETV